MEEQKKPLTKEMMAATISMVTLVVPIFLYLQAKKLKDKELELSTQKDGLKRKKSAKTTA
jgi:hypothetical protein